MIKLFSGDLGWEFDSSLFKAAPLESKTKTSDPSRLELGQSPWTNKWEELHWWRIFPLQLTEVLFFNDWVSLIWKETHAGHKNTATVPGSNKQPCQLFPICLFILWSKLAVKVHATWNLLTCKNPGVGQRGFKKSNEAAFWSSKYTQHYCDKG